MEVKKKKEEQKRKIYRELAGGGEVDLRVRPGGGKQGGELAGGDEDEAAEYEAAVAVADPVELLPDAAVALEHGGDVGEPAELAREALHPEDLQVADGPEEDADHEEDGGAVGPGGDLDGARGGGPPRGAERRRGEVPVRLVGGLGERAGEEEAGEDAEGARELLDVAGPDLLGVVAEAVEVEQAAEAAALEERREGEVGERGGQGERHLDLPVERRPPAADRGGEREGGRGRGGDGEEEEGRPRRGAAGAGGVVDAHPREAGAEAVELVPSVRHAPRVLLLALRGGRGQRLPRQQQRKRRRRRVFRHGRAFSFPLAGLRLRSREAVVRGWWGF